MTETQWAESNAEQPVRKSLPKWVWFCGGGCLLAFIVAVVATIFVVRGVQKALDPEASWAKLQEVIPADSPPPPGYQAIAMPLVPFDQVTVRADDNTQIQFQRHTGSDATQTRTGLFESDEPQFPSNMVIMSFQDMTNGSLDIQGREIRYVRMRMQLEGWAKSLAGEKANEAEMTMLLADVTPVGRENELVLMTIQRPTSRGELDDETVRRLVAPFHIGPNR